MAESARRSEAPLIPQRSSSYINPAVEDDLLTRIRSLLDARNKQRPPRTPDPSDHRPLKTLNSGLDQYTGRSNWRKQHRLKPEEIIAKLSELQAELTKASGMAITRFDGPASQIEDLDGDGPRRRPSEPSLDSAPKDRGSEIPTHSFNGLNLRTSLSRPSSGPGFVPPIRSMSIKRKPDPPKPLLNASTVPSTYPWLREKRMRPQLQHVPGSFGSAVESSGGQPSVLASPTAKDISTDLPINLELSQPSESYDIRSGTAVDSLASIKDSDTRPKELKASIRRKKSQGSIKSISSVRSLMRPHAEYSHLGQAAQPVVTRGGEQLCSENGAFDTISRSPAISTQPQENQITGEIAERPPTFGPINGTPIVQLLADLPPIKQSTIDGLSASPLVLETTEDSPEQHLQRHSTIREHSRQLSSHDEVASSAFSNRMDLPLKSDEPVDRLPGKRKSSRAKSTQSRSTPSTPLSIASRKAASLSRAITALSQFSSRSNLRMLPLRSATNYDKVGSTDEARPAGNIEDHNSNSGPRNTWIQSMLGRAPTGGTTNLTARPSDHARVGPQSQQALTNQFPRDENVHHDRSITGGTDEQVFIRRQHNNAEDFSRAISELETLLREALAIAHQAADKDDDRLKLVREHPSVSSLGSSDGGSSYSGGPDEEDHRTSVPLNANNPGITVVEPEDQDKYHGNFRRARDPTPYPASSRNPSMIPPLDEDNAKPHSGGDSHLSVEKPPRTQFTTPEPPRITTQNDFLQPFESHDWAVPRRQSTTRLLQPEQSPSLPRRPSNLVAPLKEVRSFHVRPPKPSSNALSDDAIRPRVKIDQQPSTQPLQNPTRLQFQPKRRNSSEEIEMDRLHSSSGESEKYGYVDFNEPKGQYRTDTQMTMAGSTFGPGKEIEIEPQPRREDTLSPLPRFGVELHDPGVRKQSSIRKGRRSHFSIKEPQGFSLSRSHKRAPIARDWSTSRKRWTAAVACISTSLLGLIVGIYAGEVPAIQYTIVDEHHYTILGNVVFFIGLAITTFLFFPLPLLHGRKPYTLAALAILLPLQFPQALVVNQQRSPSVATYRVGLLLSRAAAGLVMGFANVNFLATLLDLFGSSLQSSNPHQELVDANDVRRHGGGMGMWLGIWTWCFIGSIGVGFLIGAVIISGLKVAWGFWITIILTAAVLVLNVLTPETRRSAYRRSLAEVRNGGQISRRVARGEMKMHLDATGPIYWWEEVVAGWRVCLRMLKQPGFVVLSLYMGWIYGQIVLIIVLLGALTSKYYRFHPQYVGIAVSAIPIGALLATPFQKASLFSRARTQKPRTDSMTVQSHVTRSSHFIRRATFMILLPFADLAYTLSSKGTHTHFMIPIVFAGVIGFLSNLAIAECNGIIMETYDTSDLQPGMTGRPRKALSEEIMRKRTNFSCFPRVTAAFAISQAFAFLIAAAGTGTGGVVQRRLGAQKATAVVAGILLVLTVLLIAVVTRFKTVQIIPTQRYGTAVLSGPEDEWKPVIIGHPSGNTRRMSLLELGKMTRWTEIRRRNRLATGLAEY